MSDDKAVPPPPVIAASGRDYIEVDLSHPFALEMALLKLGVAIAERDAAAKRSC